jgi:hypothetical protein
MRVIALLALISTVSGVASAQTTQCQAIPKASDRLACYDRAAPPTAVGKPAASSPPTVLDKPPASKTNTLDKAASKAPTDQGTIVDMLAVENQKLDAKIKTICRGC